MAIRVTQQNVDTLGVDAGTIRVTQQNTDVLGIDPGAIRVTQQIIDVIGAEQSGVLRISLQGVEVLGEYNLLRVTEQGVEVLGAGESDLRVTEQGIEALGQGDSSLAITQQGIEALGKGQDQEIRVTQQGIEALGKGESDLRITRQGIEALGTGTSLLRITGQGIEAFGDVPLEVTVSSDIEFTQLAEHNFTDVSTENSIVFIQSVVAPIIDVSVSNTITFTHLVELPEIFNVTIESNIAFTQIADTNFKFANAINALNFEQIINGPIAASASSYLTQIFIEPLTLVVTETGLTQSVTVSGDFNLSPVSNLSFTDKLRTVTDGVVSSTVQFEHSANDTPGSTIEFGQAVNADVTKGLKNQINFSQSADFTMSFARELESDININDNVLAIIVKATSYCQYDPQGVADAAPTVVNSILTLDDGVTELELKNSDFGNTHSIQVTKIFRESRGRKLQVYRDSIWPIVEIFNFNISGLKEDKAQNLLTFFLDSLGKIITVTDHYGRNWSGIILTPDAAITEESFQNYRVTFDFEGELV